MNESSVASLDPALGSCRVKKRSPDGAGWKVSRAKLPPSWARTLRPPRRRPAKVSAVRAERSAVARGIGCRSGSNANLGAHPEQFVRNAYDVRRDRQADGVRDSNTKSYRAARPE